MATKASPRPKAAPARPKRLTAEARRRSILQAARRAFTETGDMNGTTIRHIAERGGISEGVIYRHFESKDQLFFEAVVEPLREAVDDRYGLSIEAPDVSARAVMGLALMLALEHHYADGHDTDRAVAAASSGTIRGFFPTIDPAQQRQT